VAASRSVDVQVPTGIADGQRLRLPGRGHEGEPGAPAGDLYVSVAVAEDERFHRDGNDLVSVLDVPFTQAALGSSLEVETLDGKEHVEVKPGTQPGDVLVLRGKGMPVLNGRGRGDQRVVMHVLVPRRLSDEQRDLLSRFEQSAGADTYAGEDGFLGRLRAAFR
jgi:molecular chaperone DnaJ